MKEDSKIFLKYIFNIKEFWKIIKDGFKQLFEARSLSQLCLILSILMVVLIKLGKIEDKPITWVGAIVFFLLFLYLKYLIVYQGGEWKRWYRDKQGIPSKKELIREEFDLRKEVKNETN